MNIDTSFLAVLLVIDIVSVAILCGVAVFAVVSDNKARAREGSGDTNQSRR